MGVTYVWWSDDMDEKCYVGAYVYGEYMECGGVCQWYSVFDGVVSVSIHLGGEDVLVVEGLVWADLLFSLRVPVRLRIRVKHGLSDQDSHVL